MGAVFVARRAAVRLQVLAGVGALGAGQGQAQWPPISPRRVRHDECALLACRCCDAGFERVACEWAAIPVGRVRDLAEGLRGQRCRWQVPTNS